MSAPNAASNSSLQETADQASTGGDRKFLDDAANLILGVTKQVDDITNLIIKALREHTSDDPIQLAALEHLTADLILEKEIKFALADDMRRNIKQVKGLGEMGLAKIEKAQQLLAFTFPPASMRCPRCKVVRMEMRPTKGSEKEEGRSKTFAADVDVKAKL